MASSPEAKAVDTATPVATALGAELRIEDDLREARRHAQPLGSRAAYVGTVSTYLRGEPLEGWEPVADVRRRMTEAIERVLTATSRDVAVVSHGLALSLFLGLVPEEWERIPLPAVAIVDPETRRLLGPWVSPA